MKRQRNVRQWLPVVVGSCLAMAAALAAVTLTAVAAEPSAKPKPAANQPVAGTPYGDLLIGEPIVCKNLTIFPVMSKTPKNEDRFITLDEGLRSGAVTIVEVGAEAAAPAPGAPSRLAPALQGSGRQPAPQPQQSAGELPALPTSEDPFGDAQQSAAPAPLPAPNAAAQQAPARQGAPQAAVPPLPQFGAAQVNRLMVINGSNKPLYLMPGEVISGGKQDRTIGQELVIQPNKKPVPIDVFCVEQGRWHGRDASQTLSLVVTQTQEVSGTANAPAQAAQQAVATAKAQKGEFAGSVGQLNKDARIAVQGDKNQGKVWEKVAGNNAKSGVQTDSGNYAANFAQPDVAEKLKPYLEQCGKPVLARPQVVGVVVAINGKVQSVDVFESTPLFTKLYDKLLKGFAMDAMTAADPKAAIVACPTEACVKFLDEAHKTPVAKSEVNADLKEVRRESPSIITFTTGEAAKADADSGFGGGAFGGGIHTGAFSK